MAAGCPTARSPGPRRDMRTARRPPTTATALVPASDACGHALGEDRPRDEHRTGAGRCRRRLPPARELVSELSAARVGLAPRPETTTAGEGGEKTCDAPEDAPSMH